MTEAPELSIIVPVYNEGDAVEPVLRALSATVRTHHELLVVYDFDADTTVPVIRRLEPEIPGLRGHRNEIGRGVLNAMRAGMAASRGEYVLISMADGSDDPAVIDRMVELARGGADIVAASRYMRGGRQVGGPPLKRLMSRTAGLTLHWFAGVPVHDPTNNFKLYRRSFLESVAIESGAGFELALELTVKATLAGRPLAEVPTTWRDRTAGTSNFRLCAWLPHYLRWHAVGLKGRLGRAVGLRVVTRFGWVRALRLAAAVWFLVVLFTTPTRGAFLVDPAAIGNDVSNYLAAGERLNVGHDLYRLSPGDRVVPTYPPYYVVPLVAPPPIAVLWRGLAILPEPIAVYGWWLGGLFGTIATTLWVVRRGSVVAQLGVIVLSGELAWTALSGNVNAYVLPLVTLAWVWQHRRPALAGAFLAVSIVARLTPVLLGWWALVAARRRTVMAAITTLCAIGLVSLLGAGLDAHWAWLEVARYTATSGAPDESLVGVVRGLGVAPEVAGLAAPVLAVLAGLAILAFRSWPRVGWAVASIAMVAASPVTHAGAPALALLAFVPTIDPLGVAGPDRLGRARMRFRLSFPMPRHSK